MWRVHRLDRINANKPANMIDSLALALKFRSNQIGRFFSVSCQLDGEQHNFGLLEVRPECLVADSGRERNGLFTPVTLIEALAADHPLRIERATTRSAPLMRFVQASRERSRDGYLALFGHAFEGTKPASQNERTRKDWH
jgi:hypothetical protein